MTIALAVLLAVFMAPGGTSAYHDAAAVGHVSMADADDHGHSHDIDEHDVEAASSTTHDGNHHKHNPGDHSHEKLGTPPALATLSAARVGGHLIAARDPKVRGLPSTFLRPPRPSDIA
jgi:ABC-type Zn2+ transport system substrate-binding protein/surface adhesin